MHPVDHNSIFDKIHCTEPGNLFSIYNIDHVEISGGGGGGGGAGAVL